MNSRNIPPFNLTKSVEPARRADKAITTAEAPAASMPRSKICLSIDVDSSLGHIMRESYGDRLLVDKEQARKLAVVLLEYAGEPLA